MRKPMKPRLPFCPLSSIIYSFKKVVEAVIVWGSVEHGRLQSAQACRLGDHINYYYAGRKHVMRTLSIRGGCILSFTHPSSVTHSPRHYSLEWFHPFELWESAEVRCAFTLLQNLGVVYWLSIYCSTFNIGSFSLIEKLVILLIKWAVETTRFYEWVLLQVFYSIVEQRFMLLNGLFHSPESRKEFPQRSSLCYRVLVSLLS